MVRKLELRELLQSLPPPEKCYLGICLPNDWRPNWVYNAGFKSILIVQKRVKLKELKIGIAGLGVVAQGLLEIVRNNGTLIAERTGVTIKVVRVASRSEKPGVDLMGAEFSKSTDDLWKDSQVDVVVELMGGVDVAKNLINSALASGKKVVTANKAVIALHGNELLNKKTRNWLKLFIPFSNPFSKHFGVQILQ